MSFANKIENFSKSREFQDVYLLIFDQNEANLGFFYDNRNVVSFDDLTGHRGELQYSGSKKAFFTGSKNIASTMIKLSKGAGITLQIEKTQLVI